MTISELIELLQAIQEAQGDLPTWYSGEYVGPAYPDDFQVLDETDYGGLTERLPKRLGIDTG